MKKYLIVIEKKSGARESHFETNDEVKAREAYSKAVDWLGSGKRGAPEAVALVQTLDFMRARAPQMEGE